MKHKLSQKQRVEDLAKGFKTCARCGDRLPVKEFWKNKRNKSGLANWCKLCHTDYECSKHGRSIRAAINSRWRSSDKGQAKIRDCRQTEAYRLYQYNKERRTNFARAKLAQAIRQGTVKKFPCEICGAKEVQGHHEDYEKPLEVYWLCGICHRKYHNFKKKAERIVNDYANY